MKVLIVGFSESIHTARWLRQFTGPEFDVHLFPSLDVGIVHPEMSNVTIYHSFYGKNDRWPKTVSVRSKGINFGYDFPAHILRFSMKKILPKYRELQLKRLIKQLKPDIIHSMEIQHGGYLVDQVYKGWKGKFPKWLVTNWGNDIYLFGRLKNHKDRIRSVLSHCNYYSCECERDVKLARDFGFKGEVMPVFPNAGGLDLKLVKKLIGSTPTSSRRIITLKGYQGWAGRALVGLRSLERCSDLLSSYELVIYSCSPEVELAAKVFSARTGVSTSFLPEGSPHQELLRLHGKSRISIGLSISDGVSTSFLEALAMGSFPIQSNTACADEWIECGKTGYIVPPEDPEEIEKKIRIALTDDKLVDTAAKINWETTKKRLDRDDISRNATQVYRRIHSGEKMIGVRKKYER